MKYFIPKLNVFMNIGRDVSEDDGKKLASSWKAGFQEASAKENQVRNSFSLVNILQKFI